VAGLGLDDGQGGEGAGLALDFAVGELLDVVGVDAGGPLQQTGVQVEHVAGVGFAARGALQQQGDLAVGPGLLGEIVIDDQRILAAVAVVLADGAAGVGGQVLHGGRVGGGGGDDHGVGQGPVFLELAHNVGNGGVLLADSHVDTLDAGILLVDDGVDGDGGLADLAVSDDQLPLAAA